MTATLTARHVAAAPARSNAVPAARLAALDGLRGLAVAAVVAYHAGWLRGGFLGVDLFFVISGFVITRMLLARHASGARVTLGWFWTRRARRLFPALALAVGAVVLWTDRVGGASVMHRTRGEALSGLGYVNNWYDIYAHVGYWDAELARTPLNHLWSLSVEEQFYLVWPLLFLATAARGRVRALSWIAAAGVAAAAVLQPLLFHTAGWSRAYLGTDTRLAAPLLGALVALATQGQARASHRRREPSSAARVGAVLALAAVLAGWTWCTVGRPALYDGGLLGCGVLGAVVIKHVTSDASSPLARLLAFPPLAALGRVSYSLYLWHVPVLVLVTTDTTGLAGVDLTTLRVLLIAATTLLSYHLVERPIHEHGLSVGRLVPALFAAAAFVAAAIEAPALIGHLGHERVDTTTAVGQFARGFTPDEVDQQRIMVVGDSWAARTAAAMRAMPEPKPRTVIALGRPSCGLGSAATQPACAAWLAGWGRAVEQDAPTIVVLQVGSWDQKSDPVCTADYQRRYAQRLDDAVRTLTSRGAALFVTTVVDESPSVRAKSPCMNAMLRAAVARHARERVHLVDLWARLCPGDRCATTIGGAPLYDDTDHLSDSALPAVNAWMFAVMGNALGTRVPAVDLWGSAPVSAISTEGALSLADLPDAAAFGGPGSRPVQIEPAHVLDDVRPVRASAQYASIAAALGSATSAVAYRVGSRAVGSYTFRTDKQADVLTTTLLTLLHRAHATAALEGPAIKYMQLPGRPTVVVGFLRGSYSLSVVVTTDIASARAALHVIGERRGIAMG